ncbi:hypothetical protein TELCIR_14636, partial [Teladorsagia circumcincta]
KNGLTPFWEDVIGKNADGMDDAVKEASKRTFVIDVDGEDSDPDHVASFAKNVVARVRADPLYCSTPACLNNTGITNVTFLYTDESSIWATRGGKRAKRVEMARLNAEWQISSVTLVSTKKLRKLEHENVNKFIGASIDSNQFMVVWRICSRGSLQTIIAKGTFTFDSFFMVCIIRDIAEVEDRTKELAEQKQKADLLLGRMLPRQVAERLKLGQTVEPEGFDSVTVFFSDVVKFTQLSAKCTPFQVVNLLNELYSNFDAIIEEHDVYKGKGVMETFWVLSRIDAQSPTAVQQSDEQEGHDKELNEIYTNSTSSVHENEMLYAEYKRKFQEQQF